MPLRTSLLSTTMLSGIVGATFLSTLSVSAAELFTKGPLPSRLFAPAVDGVNFKTELFGGSIASDGFYGLAGAVTMPLAPQWGLQIDGIVGSMRGEPFGTIAGHLFWRDPGVGLIGLYASHSYWDEFSGVRASHVAIEGEYYWGAWTVQGIVGVETGNSANRIVGPLLQTYDLSTRFFDQINVAYYPWPDLKVYVGHRYQGGRHNAALGGEWAMPWGDGRMLSLFAEGRLGPASHGVWGGLKMYFGNRDKSLIERHRQDDPGIWKTILGVLNSAKTKTLATSPPPPPPPPPECCLDAAAG